MHAIPTIRHLHTVDYEKIIMILLSVFGHISLKNCPILTNKGSFGSWGPLLSKNHYFWAGGEIEKRYQYDIDQYLTPLSPGDCFPEGFGPCNRYAGVCTRTLFIIHTVQAAGQVISPPPQHSLWWGFLHYLGPIGPGSWTRLVRLYKDAETSAIECSLPKFQKAPKHESHFQGLSLTCFKCFFVYRYCNIGCVPHPFTDVLVQGWKSKWSFFEKHPLVAELKLKAWQIAWSVTNSIPALSTRALFKC